jgi:hypothetical protein
VAVAPVAREVAPAAQEAAPVAGAAALAEARRVAAHPLGPRIPHHPVRRRRPPILEMHRERRMHSPAIRIAAADGGGDAAAAVQPAARRRARRVLRIELSYSSSVNRSQLLLMAALSCGALLSKAQG